ncbi:hypothetical protein CBM2585_B20052 [Cupriavidus taiwanensis]|nr:hypothetical protein CBM2585_B20052 [Cupriavidus taiwanensis]
MQAHRKGARPLGGGGASSGGKGSSRRSNERSKATSEAIRDEDCAGVPGGTGRADDDRRGGAEAAFAGPSAWPQAMAAPGKHVARHYPGPAHARIAAGLEARSGAWRACVSRQAGQTACIDARRKFYPGWLRGAEPGAACAAASGPGKAGVRGHGAAVRPPWIRGGGRGPAGNRQSKCPPCCPKAPPLGK